MPEKDYLHFTKLDKDSSLSGLTLRVIKDRFEKHPYVEFADVEFENNNIVSVEITERK